MANHPLMILHSHSDDYAIAVLGKAIARIIKQTLWINPTIYRGVTKPVNWGFSPDI
jgi:hypothetical protein